MTRRQVLGRRVYDGTAPRRLVTNITIARGRRCVRKPGGFLDANQAGTRQGVMHSGLASPLPAPRRLRWEPGASSDRCDWSDSTPAGEPSSVADGVLLRRNHPWQRRCAGRQEQRRAVRLMAAMRMKRAAGVSKERHGASWYTRVEHMQQVTRRDGAGCMPALSRSVGHCRPPAV